MRSIFIILLALCAGHSFSQSRLGDLEIINATVIKKETLFDSIFGNKVKVSRWSNLAKSLVQLSCNYGDPSSNIYDTITNRVYVSHAYDSQGILYKSIITEIKKYADERAVWAKQHGNSGDFSNFAYTKSFFVNGKVVIPFIGSGTERPGDYVIFYVNNQLYKIALAECNGFGCLSSFVEQNMHFVKDGAKMVLGEYISHIDTVNKIIRWQSPLETPYTYPDRISEDDIQTAEVSKRDSIFWIRDNIRKDYRIIGYEKPAINSRRLIIFSVFTRDVKDNPYQCPFGAYYGSGLSDVKIRYKKIVGDFILAELTTQQNEAANVYFERKWVRFTD